MSDYQYESSVEVPGRYILQLKARSSDPADDIEGFVREVLAPLNYPVEITGAAPGLWRMNPSGESPIRLHRLGDRFITLTLPVGMLVELSVLADPAFDAGTLKRVWRPSFGISPDVFLSQARDALELPPCPDLCHVYRRIDHPSPPRVRVDASSSGSVELAPHLVDIDASPSVVIDPPVRVGLIDLDRQEHTSLKDVKWTACTSEVCGPIERPGPVIGSTHGLRCAGLLCGRDVAALRVSAAPGAPLTFAQVSEPERLDKVKYCTGGLIGALLGLSRECRVIVFAYNWAPSPKETCYERLLLNVGDAVVRSGALWLVSAGNNFEVHPPSYERSGRRGPVVVSAIVQEENAWRLYANAGWSDDVDFVAPGYLCRTLGFNNGVGDIGATSAAVAVAGGAFAAVAAELERRDDHAPTPEELYQEMKVRAQSISLPWGEGRVEARRIRVNPSIHRVKEKRTIMAANVNILKKVYIALLSDKNFAIPVPDPTRDENPPEFEISLVCQLHRRLQKWNSDAANQERVRQDVSRFLKAVFLSSGGKSEEWSDLDLEQVAMLWALMVRHETTQLASFKPIRPHAPPGSDGQSGW
jgi:hypothetical protein